jgi:outer membrane protein assembly factor BamB
MHRPTRFFLVYELIVLLLPFGNSQAADWPHWRYDAQRSNASPQELPARLSLAWSRELRPLKAAWPDQPKMQFDAAYEPVVMGQRMFVGSSHCDTVTAYDTRSGEELWRFHAEGPVRFAPACWEEKVYFASDDGYLYCLAAEDGRLLWKFRGGPSDRKILGNERLISTWPARGAPVIAEDTVYFAAGIWPFMGIFLHALDARTGEVRWTNDGDGSIYIKQPHNSDSFAGVAPQGPLVAIGEKLLIPGGRSVPAGYDRRDGRLLYYALAENGKRGGGSTVSAVGDLFFNGGAAFNLATEKYLGAAGDLLTFAEGVLYDSRGSELRALDLKSSQVELVDTVDRKGVKAKTAKWTIKELAEAESPKLTTLIKAGSRLYGTTAKELLAIELPLEDDKDAKFAWQTGISGTPTTLLAADDRLFVVTREGQIHCFADASPAGSPPRILPSPKPVETAFDETASQRAESLLQTSGVTGGYAIVWGAGELAFELASRSELRVIVVEPNAAKAHDLRRRLDDRGLSGEHASVYVGDPLSVELPPYLASLMVADSLPASTLAHSQEFIARAYEVLRPYGGMFCLAGNAADESLWKAAQAFSLSNAKRESLGGWRMIIREGALPGAANWTHEHADAANTRVSKDTIVKAPLGLLWFGGTSNEAILPRHGHGPQPQVVDGRLFLEGIDLMRCTDIYTGRLLWEVRLPGVGKFYDNTQHQPGANASGTNYIATPDGIYIAYDRKCLRLDPATGATLNEFRLPTSEGEVPPRWGYINVWGDYLVGGAEPLYDEELTTKLVTSSKLGPGKAADDDDAKDKAKSNVSSLVNSVNSLVAKLSRGDNDNHSASQRLVVMNRHTGQPLWSADARSGFRHNGVCIGGGRMYAIDRLSGPQLSRLKRRGAAPKYAARLVVFDLDSGRELWSSEQDIFGTSLSYSEKHDVLIECGFASRDVMSDEPRGMRAYRAASGESLWDNKVYAGPAILHGDTILMSGSGCELLSGKLLTREHPLSGEEVQWTWTRNYGCNTPMASEHLLTFRSGAAGYFDLCSDGGTGNMGGFRSSCTNNLVVAGGLLNAPDYTRTCTCSYQNQTSLALVHLPEAEMWTTYFAKAPEKQVLRMGINLYAPGDRKAADGTLWLEHPSVGGSSPPVTVNVEPRELRWFRRHNSQVAGDGLNWVTASGAIGLESLRIKLAKSGQRDRLYTVRLFFLEPDDVTAGERLFDVAIQGHTVINRLDVAAEAGGQNRGLVREIKAVKAGEQLLVELEPLASCQLPQAVLCGVELVAEGE